jgi:hypothetical protein
MAIHTYRWRQLDPPPQSPKPKSQSTAECMATQPAEPNRSQTHSTGNRLLAGMSRSRAINSCCADYTRHASAGELLRLQQPMLQVHPGGTSRATSNMPQRRKATQHVGTPAACIALGPCHLLLAVGTEQQALASHSNTHSGGFVTTKLLQEAPIQPQSNRSEELRLATIILVAN